MTMNNKSKKYGVTKEMAEKWANEVLDNYRKSEDYRIEKAKIEKDFLDFMLYGMSTTYFDKDALETLCTEYLDVDTIIKRYSLTEKEIEDLKRLKNNL